MEEECKQMREKLKEMDARLAKAAAPSPAPPASAKKPPPPAKKPSDSKWDQVFILDVFMNPDLGLDPIVFGYVTKKLHTTVFSMLFVQLPNKEKEIFLKIFNIEVRVHILARAVLKL